MLARKLRERASGYEREVRLTVPDGRERWLMLRVHIVWSGDRAVRLRGACIDITERRAVDDLLGRTQAELASRWPTCIGCTSSRAACSTPARLPSSCR